MARGFILLFKVGHEFGVHLIQQVAVLVDCSLLQIRAPGMQQLVCETIQKASLGFPTQRDCPVSVITNGVVWHPVGAPGVAKSEFPFLSLNEESYDFRGGHGISF